MSAVAFPKAALGLRKNTISVRINLIIQTQFSKALDKEGNYADWSIIVFIICVIFFMNGIMSACFKLFGKDVLSI